MHVKKSSAGKGDTIQKESFHFAGEYEKKSVTVDARSSPNDQFSHNSFSPFKGKSPIKTNGARNFRTAIEERGVAGGGG